MSCQPFLLNLGTWIEVKDGDATGRALFRRHYSYKPYRDGRNPALFAGPGEKLVLLTQDARALFVWRKFKDDSGQRGVNCAVFRNESAMVASELIRAADEIAFDQWPGERHYTYINAAKIRATRQPGRCFLKAGWRYVMAACGCGGRKHCPACGGTGRVKARTKWRSLFILERLP